MQLNNHPAIQGSSISVVGFSMGGHWALWLSQRPELTIGAVVTFYGTRSSDSSASHAAFLGHFAEKDDWVSEAGIKKLKRSLEGAGRISDFFVYSGTSHWFFESNREDAYQSQAALPAWERTLHFFIRMSNKAMKDHHVKNLSPFVAPNQELETGA